MASVRFDLTDSIAVTIFLVGPYNPLTAVPALRLLARG